MKKRTLIHIYTVIGRGVFPYDMLRHDACWPSGDASGLYPDRTDRREIRLSSAIEPTELRWASFSWHIVNHDRVGVDCND